MDQVPSSFVSASNGPDRTYAPGSLVPLNTMYEEWTSSPSECDVTASAGGAVSDGGGSVDVVASGCVVDVASCVVLVTGVVCGVVVASGGSASVTRTASTAEAILAETTSAEDAGAASDCSAGDDAVGVNAARPTTATRAMMSRDAYASGIRGLTCLPWISLVCQARVRYECIPVWLMVSTLSARLDQSVTSGYTSSTDRATRALPDSGRHWAVD